MTSRIVSVVPDVAGLDSEFDYEFPEKLGMPTVGMRVRVPLHGRSVAGWITALDTTPPSGKTLRAVTKSSGWGPSEELIELTKWAAWRWATRRNVFLQTASPPRNVMALPTASSTTNSTTSMSAGESPNASRENQSRIKLHNVAPNDRAYEMVRDSVEKQTTLIITPMQSDAERIMNALRRDGQKVGLFPRDWAQIRAGNMSAVGTMSAAWAPLQPLQNVIVLDCHDRSLRQEGAPTWDATAVVVERARRAHCNVNLVSPTPRLEHIALANVVDHNREAQRRGWANFEVVDMREQDPRNGLFSESVVSLVRSKARVVCVLNRKGHTTLLVCASCQSVASCPRCSGRLVELEQTNQLTCVRCNQHQPVLCPNCGSQKFKHLRLGVTKAAEQLQLLAGKTVGEVTQESSALPDTEILLGTEAVLNRIGRADAIVFLDFDQDLMMQRFRANEDSLGLLGRASRIVDGKPGRVIVQTRQPDHVVIRCATNAEPMDLDAGDAPTRRALRWPPYSAIATLSGPNADAFVAGAPLSVEVLGPHDGTYMLRSHSTDALCDALNQMKRPSGRLGLRVDPYGV